MDEILHRLRNPGKMIPLKVPKHWFPMVSKWCRISSIHSTTQHMAVGQNQWHHFGVGAPPILVYFSGDWDVFTGGTGF